MKNQNQKTNGVPSFKGQEVEDAVMVQENEQNRFLPENYRIPKKSDQFMKVTVGKHKVRIMAAPIRGFVFFAEEIEKETGDKVYKPVRRTEDFGDFTTQEMIEAGGKMNDKGKIEGSKYFWLMLVWNYKEQRFQVLEITQTTVLEGLMRFIEDGDYGDPRGYDITIERTGTGKNNTKYSVIPSPPKQVDQEISDTFSQLTYNLGAVLENEYPFS